MSDEKIGGHNADTGYEHEDLSPQGVFYFMGGVAVLGVVIYFILIGMYRFLDNYDRTHQPAANPMAATTGVDPQTMNYKQILDQAQQTFPKPVLEHSEQTQYMEEAEKGERSPGKLRLGRPEKWRGAHPDRPGDGPGCATRPAGGFASGRRARSERRQRRRKPESEGCGSTESKSHERSAVSSIKTIRTITAILLLVAGAFGQGMTQGIMSPPANVRPPGLKNVGIQQNLNQPIPGDLQFTDDLGRTVRLADYFGKKPMILNLVYYNCPMLCGEVLSGLEHSLRMMKFDVGKEFDVITVSFDPERNARDGCREEG